MASGSDCLKSSSDLACLISLLYSYNTRTNAATQTLTMNCPPFMHQLWDDDLEEYARQHSQACSGAHSARSMVKNWSPLVTERWDLMAENLYWSYGKQY